MKPSTAIDDVLASTPQLWKGRQANHSLHTLPTGHARLDAQLPGGGWPLGAVTERSEQWGVGVSRVESERLAAMYKLVAESRDIGYFEAGSVAQVSPEDGVHLDAAACANLGAAMAAAVKAELARG